ncbi:MAG: hypothetical protein IPJ84_18275 [Bdellovibrionales bacterium]|nr:hypothetical protein [Bdellovibrionales bacterium]
MKRSKASAWFLSVALIGCAVMSPSAQAADGEDCGYKSVRIQGASPAEAESSCLALKQVMALFTQLGLSIEPEVRLQFQDEVYLPVSVTGGDKVRVHGYFDSSSFEIFQTHFQSSYQQSTRKPWGLKWSNELAHSFVLHEVSHLAAMKYLQSIGRPEKKISSAWHEAIAYAVQFELMDPQLREKIVARYPALASDLFADPSYFSPIIYRADPDEYAVKVYLTIQKWGGISFIKGVLDGTVSGVEPYEMF